MLMSIKVLKGHMTRTNKKHLATLFKEYRKEIDNTISSGAFIEFKVNRIVYRINAPDTLLRLGLPIHTYEYEVVSSMTETNDYGRKFERRNTTLIKIKEVI